MGLEDDESGMLLNVFEIDEDFNVLRNVNYIAKWNKSQTNKKEIKTMENERKARKHYRGEYSKEERFWTCYAESDEEAISILMGLEDYESGMMLWNVFEIDEDYNVIRTVF